MKKTVVLPALILFILLAGCASLAHKPSEINDIGKDASMDGKRVVVEGYAGIFMYKTMNSPVWVTLSDNPTGASGISGSNELSLFVSTGSEKLKPGAKYRVTGTIKTCGGCKIFPNPTIEIEKAELLENPPEEEAVPDTEQKLASISYSPIQCNGNPWDIWHDSLGRTYIRAPTEEEILKEYYSTVHGVTVISYQNIPAPPDLIVCTACQCPRGDTIRVSASPADAEKMKALGWKAA